MTATNMCSKFGGKNQGKNSDAMHIPSWIERYTPQISEVQHFFPIFFNYLFLIIVGSL